MKVQHRGFSNRYANDFGGNHIDRLREEAVKVSKFNFNNGRRCSCCKERKPLLGGSSTAFSGKEWICADCKEKKSVNVELA